MGRQIVCNKKGTVYRIYCSTTGLFLTEELTAPQMMDVLITHGRRFPLTGYNFHPAEAADWIKSAYDNQNNPEYTWLHYPYLSKTDRVERESRSSGDKEDHAYLWQWFYKAKAFRQVFRNKKGKK